MAQVIICFDTVELKGIPMDTFFATKNGGVSSRGHTCCQLFVTDKGYVYVVPMESCSEVLQAVKQFASEVGALMC